MAEQSERATRTGLDGDDVGHYGLASVALVFRVLSLTVGGMNRKFLHTPHTG